MRTCKHPGCKNEFRAPPGGRRFCDTHQTPEALEERRRLGALGNQRTPKAKATPIEPPPRPKAAPAPKPLTLLQVREHALQLLEASGADTIQLHFGSFSIIFKHE